jgi:lipoprotein-anchoring transpeptidase ErfK/SrfK
MMLSRRDAILGSIALLAAGFTGSEAETAPASYFSGMVADNGFTYRKTNFASIDTRWHRQVVEFEGAEPPGGLVVDTRNHFLYLILENKTAIRYGVGVGKEGFQWFGRSIIARKALWPRWTPPPEMRKRHPELPAFVEGGSPDNPLGPRALYLHRDGADTGYRFHGTFAPWSIGTDVSSGCVRMFNEDVIDLYQRCPIGTPVQVLPNLAEQADKSRQIQEDPIGQ